MNKLKALAFVFVFSTLSFAGQDTMVSGTWKISGEVVGNAINQTCTFTQEGNKIKGTCTAPDNGKPIEAVGEVTAKQVTWKYNSEYNGEALTITYSGKLEGAELTGTIDVQPFSVSGSFTAKKEEPKK